VRRTVAPNVGALSRYFHRVRLHPKLWHTREHVEDRPVRSLRELQALADGDARARFRKRSAKLGDESRFADAGFSGHDHEPTAAGRRV